ncbi:hypothetical protein BJX76DRAFT_71120 [Aspergillus varians]
MLDAVSLNHSALGKWLHSLLASVISGLSLLAVGPLRNLSVDAPRSCLQEPIPSSTRFFFAALLFVPPRPDACSLLFLFLSPLLSPPSPYSRPVPDWSPDSGPRLTLPHTPLSQVFHPIYFPAQGIDSTCPSSASPIPPFPSSFPPPFPFLFPLVCYHFCPLRPVLVYGTGKVSRGRKRKKRKAKTRGETSIIVPSSPCPVPWPSPRPSPRPSSSDSSPSEFRGFFNRRNTGDTGSTAA